MTDKQLYRLCKKYGARALQARRKFVGLLPEVYRRKLYSKRGFTCIYEFAAKLAGISKEQVQRVLQLDRRFQDLPLLKDALASGEVSANKLARIASVATKENESELFEKTRKLSQPALEIFIKEVKDFLRQEQKENNPQLGLCTDLSAEASVKEEILTEDGLNNTIFDSESVRPHTMEKTKPEDTNPRRFTINDDLALLQSFPDELKVKLHELKQKGLDVGALILDFLNTRETEIAREKELIAQSLARPQVCVRSPATVQSASFDMQNAETSDALKADVTLESTGVPSDLSSACRPTCSPELRRRLVVSAKEEAPAKKDTRYICVKIRDLLQNEHGKKCSIPKCFRPAKIIHHTQRFALTKNHDPRYLAPLCAGHHELAHAVDERVGRCRGRRGNADSFYQDSGCII